MADQSPVCLDCGKPGRWLCARCLDERMGLVRAAQDRVMREEDEESDNPKE